MAQHEYKSILLKSSSVEFDNLRLIMIKIATMLYNEERESHKKQIAALLQAKANYQQLISKYHSLPKIIEQKKEIIENLKLSNHKLSNEIAFRTKELDQLKKKLQQFQKVEFEVNTLEQKQRQMESQYEDYHQLNTKLQKELKLLTSESQVLRGKVIVEHNKIAEVQQELSNQLKKKQIFEKHLQQIKKSGEVLKKKIKAIKQQQKRKSNNRQRIKQADLQKEVNHLRERYEQAQRELQVEINTVYASQEQYRQIVNQVEHLRVINSSLQQQARQNQKLKQENNNLQARIAFLQNIDCEFVEQKKKYLAQLQQKHHLSQVKKMSQEKQIELLQRQLAELEKQFPQGLAQLKKNIRKKRQPRHKLHKKINTIQQELTECPTQEKTNRFKGNKLKKILLGLAGILFVFGLIISHTIGYII